MNSDYIQRIVRDLTVAQKDLLVNIARMHEPNFNSLLMRRRNRDTGELANDLNALTKLGLVYKDGTVYNVTTKGEEVREFWHGHPIQS